MHKLIAAALAAGLIATSAPAQTGRQERPALLNNLAQCRSITDSSGRLACFDRTAAAIDEAEKRKDLVVVDREQLRKTRRTLFGLTLPNLSVFGDDNQDQEGFNQVETTIGKLSQTPYGKWVFTLADGAQWEQIDSRELPIEPKAGHAIKIRRASMGSYLANVRNQVAIRVRRMR